MLTKVVFSASIALLFFCWTWKSCYSNINSEKLWKIIFPFQWVSAGYNSNNNVNNTTRPLSSSHLSTGTSEFQQNGTLPHNQHHSLTTVFEAYYLGLFEDKTHKTSQGTKMWARKWCMRASTDLFADSCAFGEMWAHNLSFLPTYFSNIIHNNMYLLTLAGQWTHGVQ